MEYTNLPDQDGLEGDKPVVCCYIVRGEHQVWKISHTIPWDQIQIHKPTFIDPKIRDHFTWDRGWGEDLDKPTGIIQSVTLLLLPLDELEQLYQDVQDSPEHHILLHPIQKQLDARYAHFNKEHTQGCCGDHDEHYYIPIAGTHRYTPPEVN